MRNSIDQTYEVDGFEQQKVGQKSGTNEWIWRFGGASLNLVAVLMLIFLYAPIVVLILFSFNSISSLNFPLAGFTLKWYEQTIHDPALIRGFQNSLKVGLLTALFSTILGTLGAFGLARRNFKGKELVSNLAIIPMTIPTLLFGVSLLIFFQRFQIPRSISTIVIGHITFTLPFVLVIVTSSLAGFDLHLEEAARDLGANSIQTFFYITLPIITPALIAGALLTFSLSFDDFIVAFLTTGTDQTLPLQIWSMLRFGLSLKVNALASMIMVFSFSIISLTVLIIGSRSIRAK